MNKTFLIEIACFLYTEGTSSTEIRKTALLKTKDIDLSDKPED